MHKMAIKPHWLLRSEGDPEKPLWQLMELLKAVHDQGSLAGAAHNLRISYRHAWGLIKRAGETFGAALVTMKRGRGAALTPLGSKLVWADKRVAARLSPILDSLASELEVELARALAPANAPILRLQASHGYAIEILRDFLLARHIPLDLKYRGGMDALASLSSSNCDLAGFHAPIGDLQASVLALFSGLLNPSGQKLIHLVTRRQGVIVARGNPRKINSIRDLAQPGLRFVNRQQGSGTRVLVDLLLQREKIDSAEICGYDSGETTHSAVAAYIASDMADAGFGAEPGARKFGLGFVPIVSERYFLIGRAETLDSPMVAPVLEILSSPQFRAAINDLPGIDGSVSGSTMSLLEAFPELPTVVRASSARRTTASTSF